MINKRFINLALNNKHQGHLATCLCCENLRATAGFEGYSDDTPGQPPEIECTEGVFDPNSYYSSLATVMHDTARHCVKFVPRSAQ